MVPTVVIEVYTGTYKSIMQPLVNICISATGECCE